VSSMTSVVAKPGSKLTKCNGMMGTNQVGYEDSVAEVTGGRCANKAVAETLHDLNNVLLAILLNADVIAWKLPSYSRVKRNLHEIERSARSGAVLVRRLLVAVCADMGSDVAEAPKAEFPLQNEGISRKR